MGTGASGPASDPIMLHALAAVVRMASTNNTHLRNLWLSAPHGRLSPWQQARALALRDVSRELHAGRTQLEWIAVRVEKVSGGHPGQDALHKFFKLVDADRDWFPGNSEWESVGDLRCSRLQSAAASPRQR